MDLKGGVYVILYVVHIRKESPCIVISGIKISYLAEFFRVFLDYKANSRRSVHSPRIISLLPLSLATDVTDATLGENGFWVGTRTGADGTATLTESFFGRSPWLHGQQKEVR